MATKEKKKMSPEQLEAARARMAHARAARAAKSAGVKIPRTVEEVVAQPRKKVPPPTAAPVEVVKPQHARPPAARLRLDQLTDLLHLTEDEVFDGLLLLIDVDARRGGGVHPIGGQITRVRRGIR